MRCVWCLYEPAFAPYLSLNGKYYAGLQSMTHLEFRKLDPTAIEVLPP
jgi:hypothetical protein